MSLAKVLTSQHLFSYFTGKFFSDEVKMFRRDAVRVELKTCALVWARRESLGGSLFLQAIFSRENIDEEVVEDETD